MARKILTVFLLMLFVFCMMELAWVHNFTWAALAFFALISVCVVVED